MSAYQNNNFLITHPKHMLLVLKRTVSKHMLKLMGKKVLTILRSNILFIEPYEYAHDIIVDKNSYMCCNTFG